jgi:hypothetical protein
MIYSDRKTGPQKKYPYAGRILALPTDSVPNLVVHQHIPHELDEFDDDEN